VWFEQVVRPGSAACNRLAFGCEWWVFTRKNRRFEASSFFLQHTISTITTTTTMQCAPTFASQRLNNVLHTPNSFRYLAQDDDNHSGGEYYDSEGESCHGKCQRRNMEKQENHHGETHKAKMIHTDNDHGPR
jgi:hypothetical protein